MRLLFSRLVFVSKVVMSTYVPHWNVPICSIFCTYLLTALHMYTSGIDPQAQAQVQDQARAKAQAQAQDQAQAPDQLCRLPVLIIKCIVSSGTSPQYSCIAPIGS